MGRSRGPLRVILPVTMLLLWGTGGCGASGKSAVSAATTTTTAPVVGGAAGGGGGGGNGAGGGAGGAVGPGAGSAPQPTDSAPTTTSPRSGPPYVVRQVENLGGETVSGAVCDTRAAFAVQMATPTVTFTMGFSPASATNGSVGWQYAFPDLGESHQAAGTYTIATPAPDGSLRLTLSARDHTVFNGFDGRIPMNYLFDLVPAAVPGCPGG